MLSCRQRETAMQSVHAGKPPHSSMISFESSSMRESTSSFSSAASSSSSFSLCRSVLFSFESLRTFAVSELPSAKRSAASRTAGCSSARIRSENQRTRAPGRVAEQQAARLTDGAGATAPVHGSNGDRTVTVRGGERAAERAADWASAGSSDAGSIVPTAVPPSPPRLHSSSSFHARSCPVGVAEMLRIARETERPPAVHSLNGRTVAHAWRRRSESLLRVRRESQSQSGVRTERRHEGRGTETADQPAPAANSPQL